MQLSKGAKVYVRKIKRKINNNKNKNKTKATTININTLANKHMPTENTLETRAPKSKNNIVKKNKIHILYIVNICMYI